MTNPVTYETTDIITKWSSTNDTKIVSLLKSFSVFDYKSYILFFAFTITISALIWKFTSLLRKEASGDPNAKPVAISKIFWKIISLIFSQMFKSSKFACIAMLWFVMQLMVMILEDCYNSMFNTDLTATIPPFRVDSLKDLLDSDYVPIWAWEMPITDDFRFSDSPLRRKIWEKSDISTDMYYLRGGSEMMTANDSYIALCKALSIRKVAHMTYSFGTNFAKAVSCKMYSNMLYISKHSFGGFLAPMALSRNISSGVSESLNLM